MKRILLALTAVVVLNQAHAAELTDILFKRSATFSERQSVSDILSQSGNQRPLRVEDAIAEACYQVDLCAGLTTATINPEYCDEVIADPKNPPRMGDECYPALIKQKYSCSEDVGKQSLATVRMAGKLLADISTMYSSYIYDYLIEGISRQLPINIRELIENPAAMEEFERTNPHAKILIETISGESLSLAAYTLDCYDSLNKIMYTKNQTKIKRYYNLYKAIINTMGLFPEHKGKVNRGVNLPKFLLTEHHKIGNVVCYDSFTSTAIHDPKTDMGSKPRNGFLSGKCTQRLYISYNDEVPGGKSISKGSTSKGENEILFEPGACFRIDNVTPRTDAPTEDDEGVNCGEGESYNFEMTLVK